jgi:hypothetical protein
MRKIMMLVVSMLMVVGAFAQDAKPLQWWSENKTRPVATLIVEAQAIADATAKASRVNTLITGTFGNGTLADYQAVVAAFGQTGPIFDLRLKVKSHGTAQEVTAMLDALDINGLSPSVLQIINVARKEGVLTESQLNAALLLVAGKASFAKSQAKTLLSNYSYQTATAEERKAFVELVEKNTRPEIQ